jgi:transaldolase
MTKNPILALEALGQSVWLDFISRNMIGSGELDELIEADGISGVTSNPTIFETAIGKGHDYDEPLGELAKANKSAREIYEALTVEDIQIAADLFRPTYDRRKGSDGFVSLEVSPHLADDTEGTLGEAYRLWEAVSRPNVFIKVPATAQGLPAIQSLISNGINVNITLLFGLGRYRQVAEAYLAGLEERALRREPLGQVASVASFFISRIDTLVDARLEEKIRKGGAAGQIAAGLRGQVAVANARVAYQIYREILASERFRRLAAQGAQPQRLLWASTSTKNAAYQDTKYVEALIGPETINTLPLETLKAYRDHGQPRVRLTDDLASAQAALRQLGEAGIQLPAVALQLEDEGAAKFNKSYDALLATLEERRLELCCEPA